MIAKAKSALLWFVVIALVYGLVVQSPGEAAAFVRGIFDLGGDLFAGVGAFAGAVVGG